MTSSTNSPQARVQQDIKEAMKAGEKERLGTLRMLLTEIKNEAIRSGAEVAEDRFIALVKKAIKQRKDSSEQFRKGDRPEMADKEDREAALLGVYLPAQAGEEEIRRAISELVSEEGLSGPAAIGQVMRAMMSHFGASADGGTINRIAREVLAESR